MADGKTEYELLKQITEERYIAAVVAIWRSNKRGEWLTIIEVKEILVNFGISRTSAHDFLYKHRGLDKAADKNLILKKELDPDDPRIKSLKRRKKIYKLAEKGSNLAEGIYEAVILVNNLS